MAGTPNLQVEWGTDDKNHKTYGVLGYPILRHTELELFDLCPKAAGTSFWKFRAVASCHLDLTLFHGSGEVVGLLHDPVPKPKLGRSCTENH